MEVARRADRHSEDECMTHDQVAGLLSGLVGISVLVVGYLQMVE